MRIAWSFCPSRFIAAISSRSLAVLFACFALCLPLGAVAHAGLMGANATAAYYFPDTATVYGSSSFAPSSFVIGPGIETTGDIEGVTNLVVDFDNSSLRIMLNTVLSNPTWNTVAFNGSIFSSLLPWGITSATVNAATTLLGFDNSRVSFTATDIFVNWQGLSYHDGDVISIDFATLARAVPEPFTLILVGSALLAAGVLRRRTAMHPRF